MIWAPLYVLLIVVTAPDHVDRERVMHTYVYAQCEARIPVAVATAIALETAMDVPRDRVKVEAICGVEL